MVPEADGQSCIEKFDDCVVYGVNEDGLLTCFECSPQMYWDQEEEECSETFVDHCDTSDSLTTCLECDNQGFPGAGYYLEFD